YFLAQEYVDGQNLASIVRRARERHVALRIDLSLYVASEAAKALEFAHRYAIGPDGRPMSIVHRDISPHNILVSYNGEVKVTDFGIAHVGETVPGSDAVIRGKIAYFSPEQAGFRTVDARSDLFSLGLVLYELVTLDRLF